MKNPAHAARKLAALLKKMGHVPPPELPSPGDPLAVLVMSFLLWGSTTDKARAAYERIMSGVVDFNDLRICMPHETLEMIGPRYPNAVERTDRMRAALRNIFLREHAMKLDHLAGLAKREARKYLDTLDGMVPFVASRVLLLSFETHTIPVDEQLRGLLVGAEIGDESIDASALSTWLASQVRAADGPATHYALQAWVDRCVGKGPSERKGAVRKPRRKAANAKR